MRKKLAMIALVVFLVAAVPQTAQANGWNGVKKQWYSLCKWWDEFISAPGLNARGLGG